METTPKKVDLMGNELKPIKDIKQLNDSASVAIPTLQELAENTDMSLKHNNFMVLLNQAPPESWVKKHQGEYIPIERVEWLLSYLFVRWWVEIKETKLIANSCVVTVRLWVVNPIDQKETFQDGVGACPIQVDAGCKPMETQFIKAFGVQMAMPAAESYAIKDAAEKLGKLFGKDIGRKQNLSYDSMLRGDSITLDDLKQLAEEQKDNESISVEEWVNIERVINDEEKKSYTKIHKLLTEKSK